jgi:hypothetical protein
MAYVQVKFSINAPVEHVWGVISAFGALSLWCPSVKSCALEGFGLGSIRTAFLHDVVPEAYRAIAQRERLEAIDAEQFTFTYSLLQPSALPLKNVRSTMQLFRRGTSKTEIFWDSAADDEPSVPKEVVGLIEAFYSECLANLKLLLEVT